MGLLYKPARLHTFPYPGGTGWQDPSVHTPRPLQSPSTVPHLALTNVWTCSRQRFFQHAAEGAEETCTPRQIHAPGAGKAVKFRVAGNLETCYRGCADRTTGWHGTLPQHPRLNNR